MELSKKEHWENVFATKAVNEVSWYQPNPETSLQLFERYGIDKKAKIIEIGGGDSYLIDHLLLLGYEDLTVLDISEKAIERLKTRLGDKAKNVNFIVSDVLDFQPTERYDVWHDRASFHFLTKTNDIQKYVDLASKALTQDGFLFLATFSANGPLKCSGLTVTQYDEPKIGLLFQNNFQKLNCFMTNHQTPFDTIQNFIFCSFQKK
ncbi:class I SAM-dependent methyltransferase [Flavobacterium sp. NRK F10]|uniref:class I SAM-dependent methyltransferase n=1 Tax=Flavobacterium sp. NRK F10 TaxID=2954931 RepID=UPI0020901CB4|nr:class I SAM-dependent methyltransferase [Flavobacterium sp. NRK F10]MCO6173574.1 class I SAM-dependent methyltransferase [Flavobacterium sp. NRK F10]